MKASESPLSDVMTGRNRFKIPIFQRTYNWKLPQWQQLWDDILKIGGDGRNQLHFIGSLVYIKEVSPTSRVQTHILIDGQQRLTTISLLVHALCEAVSKERGDDDKDLIDLQRDYLFNDTAEGDLHFKLELSKQDKETLQKILKNNPLPADFSQNIKEASDFFKKYINESNIGTVINGIRRLLVIDVILEKDDNPQLIFESLNSTGLDLSQADLIRNFVLMGFSHSEQTELYNTYWYELEKGFGKHYNEIDKFMRHYLTVKARPA